MGGVIEMVQGEGWTAFQSNAKAAGGDAWASNMQTENAKRPGESPGHLYRSR